VGRFPGQFLRRTELIKRSLRLDDEPKWWCREPLQVSPAVPSPSGAASISPESLRPSAADLVEQFLKRLGEARTPAEFGSLAPQRVVAAIPSRTCPPSVSVSHTNGRVSVNNRRPTVLK